MATIVLVSSSVVALALFIALIPPLALQLALRLFLPRAADVQARREVARRPLDLALGASRAPT